MCSSSNFRVKFYKEKDGDIFAFFPEETWSTIAGRLYVSYSHIGQHSGCHPGYIRGKKLATPEEYAPLLAELKGQGYDDLIVLNKP